MYWFFGQESPRESPMPRKIPRMSRVRRRELIRTGRRYGDAATAVRFRIVAELAAQRRHRKINDTRPGASAERNRERARRKNRSNSSAISRIFPRTKAASAPAHAAATGSFVLPCLLRSRDEVARRLSVSVSTVVKGANRYVEMGIAGLFDQCSANGPTKVDEAFLRTDPKNGPSLATRPGVVCQADRRARVGSLRGGPTPQTTPCRKRGEGNFGDPF